ncbi:hypothetical protein ACFOKI_10455 [Sphingomonas qilianensis]|uniref:Flap endonuclease-1-like 5' DNA nuclease n=1 Tax=Sphingomonas qilianensis TaxID=1736690 RepID=A0ABU9XPT6_9SPHN
MLFTTPPQFIVLIILFVGGLLLGLGLHPGGKKWRKRFRDESGNYAQFRRDADKQIAEANRRIAELERENATLQDEATRAAAARGTRAGVIQAVPVSAAPPPEPRPDTPSAPAAAQTNTWFSVGRPDLGRIRGIDAELKTSLFGMGLTRYEDIIDLSPEDEMALEQRLALPPGHIAREAWREQAALLRDGHDAEHAQRFALG